METDLKPRRLIRRGDLRQPASGWLNYPPGIDDPDPYRPMGPNLIGELLWPVMVQRLVDRTRVGFAYIAPRAPEGGTNANR